MEEQDNIREYLLGLDDLQQPKMIDMSIISNGVWNSAIILIMRLILLKKGIYPDHPDLGIDIRARYKFAFETELFTLQEEIQSQINKYLPELNYVQVRAMFEKYNDKYCVIIVINIEQMLFTLFYDIQGQRFIGLEGM